MRNLIICAFLMTLVACNSQESAVQAESTEGEATIVVGPRKEAYSIAAEHHGLYETTCQPFGAKFYYNSISISANEITLTKKIFNHASTCLNLEKEIRQTYEVYEQSSTAMLEVIKSEYGNRDAAENGNDYCGHSLDATSFFDISGTACDNDEEGETEALSLNDHGDGTYTIQGLYYPIN